LWPEWNENDVNAEKWEGVGKAKDAAKAKPASAPVTKVYLEILSHMSYLFINLIK
jgi:hypothetical protein